MYYDKHVNELLKDIKRLPERYIKNIDGIFYDAHTQTFSVTDSFRTLIALDNKGVGRTGFVKTKETNVRNIPDEVSEKINTKPFFQHYAKSGMLDKITSTQLKALSARSRRSIVQIARDKNELVISRVDDVDADNTVFTELTRLTYVINVERDTLTTPACINERYVKQLLTFLLAFQKDYPTGSVEFSMVGGINLPMFIGRDQNNKGLFKYIVAPYHFKPTTV